MRPSALARTSSRSSSFAEIRNCAMPCERAAAREVSIRIYWPSWISYSSAHSYVVSEDHHNSEGQCHGPHKPQEDRCHRAGHHRLIPAGQDPGRSHQHLPVLLRLSCPVPRHPCRGALRGRVSHTRVGVCHCIQALARSRQEMKGGDAGQYNNHHGEPICSEVL